MFQLYSWLELEEFIFKAGAQSPPTNIMSEGGRIVISNP